MIDLIQRSTIHGVNHAYSETNKIGKCFWLLLLICGVVGISVNVVFLIFKYISEPVIITYTLDHKIFKWPDLTFCNPSAPYYFQEIPSTFVYWNEIYNQSKDVIQTLANETEVFSIIHQMQITDFELEDRTVVMTSANPIELNTDKFASTFDFIGYSKKHNGIDMAKQFGYAFVTPFTEDLRPIFTTQFVQIRNNIPCHTFKVDKSEMVDNDIIRSLTFNLKINSDNYKIFNSSYTSRSIFLYVNNKDEIPFEPLVLTTGFSHSITVSQSHFHYSNLKRRCRYNTFDIELYDAMLNSTKMYEGNIEDCKKIQSQKLFVKNCQCYSPFLPIYKNKTGFPRLCLNATLFSKSEILRNAKCMVNTYNQYKNESDFNNLFLYKCSQYFRVKCDDLKYNVDQREDLILEVWSNTSNDRRNKVLRNFYKSVFNTNKIHSNFNNELKDSLILITIERKSKYADLYYEQKEYPFSELLSDIGGLMGLWLGMSVVGLFEIVEYFYLYVQSICKDYKKNNGKNDNDNNDNNNDNNDDNIEEAI